MSLKQTITLNPDCLLTIFDHLTSRIPDAYTPIKHRPLNTLRAASQVCRQWRDLILASPFLWGRVVDFGFEMYGPRRRCWMEEVVRRAGDKAPLWITGDLVECRPGDSRAGLMFDAQAFFIRLLVLGAWERIEQLSVTIHPNRIPERILDAFASRAPILTVFDVRFDGFGELLLVPTSASSSGSSASASEIESRRLFSDYAPSLLSINPDRVAFSTDAPWLAHIRSIEIPFWMSLKNIFDVLRNSPSLDHFSLDRTIHRRMDTDIEVIPLPSRYAARQGPNLSYIHICGTSLAPTAAILSYVSPGVTLRCFAITVDNRYPDTQDREAVPLFRQALPFYITRYFNTGGGSSNSGLASSSTSTDVSLELSPGNFAFQNTLDTITTYTDPSLSSNSSSDSDADSDSSYEVPDSQARGSFEMNIEYPFRNSNICGDPLTTSLLDAFAESAKLNVRVNTGSAERDSDQRPFSSTTRLKLCFTGLYNRQTSLTLYPHLDAMLASFEHVHILFINELSSHILWNTVKIWRGRTLPKDHHSQRCTDGNSNHVVLFPKLHTLYLDTLPSYYKGSKSHLRHQPKGIGLKRFLLERKRIGLPVSRLDLTRCARSHYAQDLRSLENVGGLEVVWKKRVGPESEAREDEICRYVCGSGDPERLKGIF